MADAGQSADGLPHDNLNTVAVTLQLLFPSLATVFLALRLYSRTLTRTFAADDVVIGIAAVIYWAFTFASYKLERIMYVGYHYYDIPEDFDILLGLKYGYASLILYNPILALVKTSILLFLLRLTGQKVAVKRSIIGLLIFNGLMLIMTFLLTVFQCIPVAAYWDSASYPNAKCLNFADFVTGTASVGIFTDVLVLMLPTWIVYDLKIQRKQKLMLIGILSFGLVTVICGLVRLILLDRYDRHPPLDSTYSILYCVSTFEIGLSFIAACAPSLKPIITKVAPKIFASSGLTGGKYSKGATGRQTNTNSKGYQLDQVTRRTEVQHTVVDAAENSDGEFNHVQGKEGIMLTTKTEIRWDERGHRGTSTESLV